MGTRKGGGARADLIISALHWPFSEHNHCTSHFIDHMACMLLSMK